MVTDVIEKTCHMVFGDSVHPGEDGLALYYGRGSVRGVAPKCENPALGEVGRNSGEVGIYYKWLAACSGT